jgi:hypothetical protein
MTEMSSCVDGKACYKHFISQKNLLVTKNEGKNEILDCKAKNTLFLTQYDCFCCFLDSNLFGKIASTL